MTDKEIKKEIDSITSQIVEKYKPLKIILFGSAARGKFTEDSDLDFFVVKKDVPYLGRDRYRELSRLIERDVAVDFVIYTPEEYLKWAGRGDPFLTTIDEEGKLLYET
ncbi:MAG: nucleotidyltransferase domain-containing protein [Candidatus Margulisiibacteriota bacterium]